MAQASVFDFVCNQLQSGTSLSDLEVRGTVRLALKQSGLDARGVSGPEMTVVLRKVLPAELEQRSVANAAKLCEDLAARVAEEYGSAGGGAGASSVEAVFRRLGGAQA